MVIRMRHTRSHTANRRSHHALKAPTLATCSNCSATHRPHHMCLGCGFYKGRMVVDMTAKKNAREARLSVKREAIAAGKGNSDIEENVEAPKKAIAAKK
ncbi:MAG: ribosomal protein large subunit ribosomal protein [Candidatus Parcubacteria bacterium]